MFNKHFKRIIGFVLAVILVLSVLPVETANAVTNGSAVNAAQKIVASLTEGQLESYQVLNLDNRQSGLVGFEDGYTLEGSGLVNVIVEFVHQPPVVAQIHAAFSDNAFLSINEATALAEKDHIDFANSLTRLFGMARGVSSYSVTAEYRVAMNGVAMKLPADKVADIAAFDSVFAVYPDELVTLDPIERQISTGQYTESGSGTVVVGMNDERSYMGIDELHARGITGKDITVCIIDTGIDYYHPDFTGAFATASPSNNPADLCGGYFYGRNFVKYGESPYTSGLGLADRAANDPMEITYQDYETAVLNGLVLPDGASYLDFVSFHGTHVAGTVGARGLNSPVAAKGIAPEATIYTYRVLSYGGGLNSWIISGIEMTATDKPDVVNMSLGMDSGNVYSLTSQAVNRIMLANPNIVFVVAAGNYGLAGSFSVGAPSSAALPITVGNAYMGMKNHTMTAKVTDDTWYPCRMNLFYGSTGTSFTKNAFDTYTSDYADLAGKDVDGYYDLVALPRDGYPIDDYIGDWNIGTGTAEEFAAYEAENGPGSLAGKVVAVYRGAPFLETWALAKQYHVGALLLIDNDPWASGNNLVYRGGVKDRPPFFSAMYYDGFGLVNDAREHGGKFKFTDSEDRKTGLHSTSSRGPVSGSYDIRPDVVGPGQDVYSTVPYFLSDTYKNETPVISPADDRYSAAYASSTGTSMASPHIAGIAALMKQYCGKYGNGDSKWNAEEIKARLMNTADLMSGYSVHEVGAGFVNPVKAIDTNITVAAHNNAYTYTKTDLADERSDYTSGLINFGVYRVYENSDDFEKTIRATITNRSDSPKTFSVGYSFNSAGALVENAGENNVALRIDESLEALEQGASSDPVIITVGGNDSADFYATVNVPKNANNGSYQGYVILTNTDGGGETYRMPFAVHSKATKSAFERLILNQPVISTSEDSIHLEGISNTADLLVEFAAPKNMYFGVIGGDATEDEWKEQINWKGEFGVRNLEGFEETDTLYLFRDIIWGGYHKYRVEDGRIVNDEEEPIAVLEEGHYKLVVVAYDNEDEEYVAVDFYVDNTPSALDIPGLIQGTDGDPDTLYYQPGDTEVVITGTLNNTNLADIKAANVSYDVWDDGDEMPRVPDQTYNALYAQVNGVYIRATITDKDTGAFTLRIPVTESALPTPVKLYILDSFSIRPFPELTTYGIKVVMGAFDPGSPSLGFNSNGERWGWYGANMVTKDIELCVGGIRIVMNDSMKLSVGASRQNKARLTPEAVNEGYALTGYFSSDINIASVDANGVIEALSEGTAVITITATCQDKPALTAQCAVTVVTNISAGVKLDPGSYIYYGSYRHVLQAEMKTTLHDYPSGGTFTIPPGYTYNTHFAATSREETPTPMLWRVMGEEQITDDGKTDGYLTLMSHYVLDVADLMPMANYYFNSGNATLHASDLQRYLNGYDPIDWGHDPVTGNYTEGALFFRNYFEDVKEWEAKNWHFLNNFNTAENNAIPYYDVWAGVYDANGVQNTGYVGGVIPNQKVYIPGSGFTSGTNFPFASPTYFSMYWGAGSGERLYDSNTFVNKASVDSSGNLAAPYTNTLKATLKSGQPITWRDRAGTANVVPMWGTTISPTGGLQGFVSGRFATEYNGVYLPYAKVGVRPATKIIPESIVYAYEITSGGGSGAIQADNNYLLPSGLSGKVYKLTVIGENDGFGVGRLYDVPVSYIDQSAIDGAYLTLSGVTSDNSGAGYVIAYKIVDESNNIAKYGELPTSQSAQDLKINIDGLSGDYRVYIWLQKNNDISSNTAGVVSVFDLHVDESADEVLYSIVTPDAVKDVPHGTAKTAEALGLPETVALLTNKGSVTAGVTWNVAECGYDTDLITAQDFAVTGEIALPADVRNAKLIELVVYISVSVKAKFFPVEGIDNVPKTAVAGLDLVLGGTVTPANATNQAITWSVDSAGTTGAVINGNILSTTGKGTVSVKAAVENGLTETTAFTALYDIAVRETPGKLLLGIINPAPITGLVNGTPKTADALCLPATVTLNTNGGNVSAKVTWDVAGSSYIPTREDEQTFDVSGAVTLPGDVSNINGISLSVSVRVTVNSGVAAKKVLRGISVRPNQILGVTNGAPKTAEGLCLPKTVFLNTDAGYVQADVVWNVGSCAYNESDPAMQEFNVSGNAVLPSDVVDTNGVGTSVSVFVRVGARITTDENLQTIINPDLISDLANGTAKTADALGLPSTVVIWTESWYMLRADVEWLVDDCSYDQWQPAAQSFTVYGNVTLPDGLTNTSNLSLVTSVEVTVKAAAPKALILQDIVRPDEIRGITNGTPKTASALGLPSYVMIITDGGNMSAVVAWNVNGANYEPGLLTEQTFTVDGAVTLPAGVDNTSGIGLSVSVSVTVNGASDLTKVLLNIIAPNPVANIPNGAQKTAEALKLPATVALNTSGGVVWTNVTWDVSGANYNPELPTAQTFTVNGKAVLPPGIDNTFNVSPDVAVSVTVNAVARHLVMFETNGGNQVRPQTVNAGDKVTVPSTPVRDGYTFTGWYTTSGLNELYDFNQPVAVSFTLYAGWTPVIVNTYTVTFETNGGSHIPEQTVVAGSIITAPATPLKAGYSFDGWFTDRELTIAFNFAWPVTVNFTLYAKWTEVIVSNDHTVVFISNGGSGVNDQKIVDGGRAIMVYPIREGYDFTGWYTDRSFTSLYNFNTPVTADLTLYAGWNRIRDGGSQPGGEIEPDPTPYWTPVPQQPAATPTPTPSPTPAATPTPTTAATTTPTPTQTTTPTADFPDEIVNVPIIPKNNPAGTIEKDEGDGLVELSIWGQSGLDSDEININIGSKETIEISGSAAEAVIETGRSLSITNDALTVVIPPETLSQLIGGNTVEGEAANETTVEIQISSSLEALIPGGLLNENPVNKDLLTLTINVTVLVDGKEITDFILPLKLVFDLSGMNLTDEQKGKLTVIRMHPDGTYEQIGGEWEDGKFTAYTSMLSRYTVIVSETLVKVMTTVDSNVYTVNGTSFIADVEPFIHEGRVMVPVKFIAEAFGAEVTWTEWNGTVAIALDGRTIALTIGRLDEGMDVAPFIYQDRTMVPLRFISEKLGANVIWNPETRTVTIYR